MGNQRIKHVRSGLSSILPVKRMAAEKRDSDLDKELQAYIEWHDTPYINTATEGGKGFVSGFYFKAVTLSAYAQNPLQRQIEAQKHSEMLCERICNLNGCMNWEAQKTNLVF